MIDAATIRKRLAACKRDGLSFDAAWTAAVGAVPARGRRGEDMSAARFAFESFRDHYLGVDRTVNALSPELSDEDYSVTSRGRNRAGRGDSR